MNPRRGSRIDARMSEDTLIARADRVIRETRELREKAREGHARAAHNAHVGRRLIRDVADLADRSYLDRARAREGGENDCGND